MLQLNLTVAGRVVGLCVLWKEANSLCKIFKRSRTVSFPQSVSCMLVLTARRARNLKFEPRGHSCIGRCLPGCDVDHKVRFARYRYFSGYRRMSGNLG